MKQIYGELGMRLATAAAQHGIGAMIERDPQLTETTSRITMWVPDERLEECLRLIEDRPQPDELVWA